MAPPRRPQIPQKPVVTFDTIAQVDQAIADLNTCIEDVRQLAGVAYDDAQVGVVENRVKNTIGRIFGDGSPEFEQNRDFHILRPLAVLMIDSPFARRRFDPRPGHQLEFGRAVPKAVVRLQGLVTDLERRRPAVAARQEQVAYGPVDAALVCLNGHVINTETHDSPARNRSFCPRCGQPTVSACPTCQQPIPGQSREEYRRVMTEPPRFCHACGRPYPWTAEGIKAAKAMAEELEGLTDVEKIDIAASIDQMATDGPQTTLGAVRFKRLFGKVKGPLRDLFRETVIAIAVETAKQAMGLGTTPPGPR